MRKKYKYLVNNKEMSKKEFEAQLKMCCQKVINTTVYFGWCGVDMCEFDKEKFNSYMRDIERGVKVITHGKNFVRKQVV